MKFLRFSSLLILISPAIIALQACKAKKLAQKPSPPAVASTPVPLPPPKPQPVAKQPPAPAEKPELNIDQVKIQFDFNSSVLNTASYPILDQLASQIKPNGDTTYFVNGYASIEGTAEHNLTLSRDRANAVKTYLVNAGVNAGTLKTKGFGTRHPVADNNTEAGRILNRRVEVKTKP